MLAEIMNNPEKLAKYIKWESKRYKRLDCHCQKEIAQRNIEKHTEQYINLTGELPDCKRKEPKTMNQYSGLEKLNADLTQKVLATKQEPIDPQPGIPIVIEADITGKLLTWKASFKDTSQKQIKAWTNQFFNAMGIKASKVEVFPAAASRYKNDRNIARLLLIPTLPKTRGGKRAGSGMKPIHTNPDEKERSKKYRATNAEWERFKELTPTNSREAFLQILDLLEKNASD